MHRPNKKPDTDRQDTTSSDLIKKIRRIEIKALGLSRQLFSGQYHSAFKGRGMEFSEVRRYQYGDDIRDIDWNVTARTHSPHVKVFEEERDYTMMLLIDVSGSTNIGLRTETKQELIATIAATLAFSAMSNGDKVGCIFFSDQIEKYIPPSKGSSHVLRIIADIIQFRPRRAGTSIATSIRFLNNVITKRCTAFVLSDFYCLDDSCEDALRTAIKKHDIVMLRVFHHGEVELPDMGLQWLRDLETGKVRLIDTGSATVRRQFADWHAEKFMNMKRMLNKYGLDHAMMMTDEDFAKPLTALFRERRRKMRR